MATAAAVQFPVQENASPNLQLAPSGVEQESMDTSAGVAVGGEPAAQTSPTSPLLPLPENFMSALNMKPQAAQGNGGQQAEKKDAASGDLVLGPGSKEELAEKFKKNPSGVLDLLQSSLSMEKLAGLLRQEHRKNSDLLLQLQNRLEAAYYTLKECEEVKEQLAVKISDTNYKIGDKRKHLENLRKELKVLGDEEQKLKRRRDLSHGKYYKLKKQLNSSVEALEQIEVLSKSFETGEEEADLTEQETTEEKVDGEIKSEVNGNLDSEAVGSAPTGVLASDKEKSEAGTSAPMDEPSAVTAKGVTAAGEGLAASSGGEGVGTSGPTDEPVTGEGSTPTENSASRGEVNPEGGEGTKEATKTGDATGTPSGDTAAISTVNLTPTTTADDEILPFIGNDDINLLDQENFPLPRVENEGEGVGPMATTPQDSSHMLSSTEVDDQVSALMRQATPSDSALPFSDLPFS